MTRESNTSVVMTTLLLRILNHGNSNNWAYKVLLPRGRAAATGYSSLLVCLSLCLSVCYFRSAHLAATALRLQHG